MPSLRKLKAARGRLTQLRAQLTAHCKLYRLTPEQQSSAKAIVDLPWHELHPRGLVHVHDWTYSQHNGTRFIDSAVNPVDISEEMILRRKEMRKLTILQIKAKLLKMHLENGEVFYELPPPGEGSPIQISNQTDPGVEGVAHPKMK